ncbi:hypothetical protein Thimo_0986 [Thioflavicoccus mobilis 8321]|uniref:Uncharacterized protein n=1 Tax=Thioflavicoccus mobilis 8321 TaxID=765912 RepID=L0GWX4_9GAMM|nr:hypothetical protein [Thioflavicoccus mobilis]AGA89809.1 hypothetical protein Thimo_0986 [Thioflavicoccus mobilis 8321]
MKTDHPIYPFPSAGAEAFRVLTGGREWVNADRFGLPRGRVARVGTAFHENERVARAVSRRRLRR